MTRAAEIASISGRYFAMDRDNRWERRAGVARHRGCRSGQQVGRRCDDSSPMMDARLVDGSRVNAVIPPLAIDGSSLTIRKFAKERMTATDFISSRTASPTMMSFLAAAIAGRCSCIVAGGTGSGKTTLLNVLSAFIPDHERLVTIEDAAELQLKQSNLVRLESRPPNMEGRGEVSIHQLVINALRMRPDRIIVGECRGAEAIEMLARKALGILHDLCKRSFSMERRETP